MKAKNFIFLVFISIISINNSIADEVNTIYSLSLDVLGVDVKVAVIKSKLNIKNEKYQFSFTLEPEKLISFISPITGNGNVYGEIDNSILTPINYDYTYIKKNKIKNTKIKFNNSNVIKSSTTPSFDKDKLSPIHTHALNNVIDPITGIIYIGDYILNNGCTITYKIYDGKRRYDLDYTDKFYKNGFTICRLSQKKIGGFKLKNQQNTTFEPAYEIDTYFKKENDRYILKKIISKGRFSNILIDVFYD
mgnify:FL=1